MIYGLIAFLLLELLAAFYFTPIAFVYWLFPDERMLTRLSFIPFANWGLVLFILCVFAAMYFSGELE